MRKLIFGGVLVLGLYGCGTLDTFTGYDPVTDTVAPAAPIETVTDTVDNFGPWGAIAASAIGIAGGIYILVRKIQKKLKK